LEGRQITNTMIYLDPHQNNKNRYFFRIKNKYLDDFWEMSDTEMLLLISIWLKNKKQNGNDIRKFQISNEEWRNIKLGKERFKIAGKNNYESMKKFEKIGIIQVEGNKQNRKLIYDFKKEEKKFKNIPLIKIKHYLQTFGKTNIRTYIYILKELYNGYNFHLSNSNELGGKKFGVRSKLISQKQIGKAIKRDKSTIYRHLKKLVEHSFLFVKKEGRSNKYYIPIYKNDEGYFYTENNKKIKDTKIETKKDSKQNIWVNSEGKERTYSQWKEIYGSRIEKIKEMGFLKRKVV